MKISGVTVSVNYADYLSRGIERWKRGLDSLIVATAPTDLETIGLCNRWDVAVHKSNAFTRNGAIFNKAGALAEAALQLREPEWILLFDADIIPPSDWRELIEDHQPKPGTLYGATRYDEAGKWLGDSAVVGFFMLFHVSDPRARRRPLFDDWANASGYDSEFEQRWGDDHQEWIDDLYLMHLGPVAQNWCGRGNVAGMRAMHETRRARRGWRHERLSGYLGPADSC